MLALLFGFHTIAAHADTRFTFQTPYDKFELTVSANGKGTIDGKPADLTSFTEILPMLTKPLENECATPPPAKPTITVRTATDTRSIYPKQGLVTDGKNCLNVSGDGLHYFPVHRDFFVGAKRDSIHLKSPTKIFRGGDKIISLRKQGKEWVNENPQQLLNWDFIEKLENALKDFDIRLRVQQTIAEGKPKMIIQSGDRSYEFYKITGVMWAVKKPGAKWLEASDDWSQWYDFDAAVYEDRNRDAIKTAGDTTRAKDERRAALDKLNVTWSRNLRDLYHQILTQNGEDTSFQSIALKRLKGKPSIETAGVVIKFLEKSQDEELKREAGILLKLQNPKGPKYNPQSSDAEKAKTLEYWRTWWKQNSSQPQP